MKKVKLLTCVSAAGNHIVTFLDGGKVRTLKAGNDTAEMLMRLAPGTEVFVDASGDMVTAVYTEEPEPAGKTESETAERTEEPAEADAGETGELLHDCGKQTERISEALSGCCAETACETAMRRVAARSVAVIEQYGDYGILEETADVLSLVRRTVDRDYAWNRLTVMTAVLLMYAAEAGRGSRKPVAGSLSERCAALEAANAALSMLLCMPYEPGLSVAFGEILKVIYSPGTVETMSREASLFRSVMKEVGRWKE